MPYEYVLAKARHVLTEAGGDPAVAEHLAKWAEKAKTNRGMQAVIVGEDGAIVGEATTQGHADLRVLYADDATIKRWNLQSHVATDAVHEINRARGVKHLLVRRGQVTQGHAGLLPGDTDALTPAEFLSILEQTGHPADEDAARLLSKSRSMIQKMKSGERRIYADTAAILEGLQDAYADDLERTLTEKPSLIIVPRDSMKSWDDTGRPAKWWRMIAAIARQDYGARIEY